MRAIRVFRPRSFVRHSRVIALSLALAAATAAVAGQESVPGEVIVRYRSAHGAGRKQIAAQLLPTSRVMGTYRFIDAEHLRVPEMSTEAIIARLRGEPDVLYVEPNYVITADAIPDDPGFTQQWGLHNTGQGGAYAGDDIDAAAAWNLTTGDPELLVGVIDTGIDYGHPDLAANMWTNPLEIPDNGIDDDGNGYDDDIHGFDVLNWDGDPMDDGVHGTHVAGTIAAVGNNGIGVTGVAWHCRLVAIKFMNGAGVGSEAGAIAAIQYAMTLGLKLTNNSWGNMPGGQALLDAIGTAGAAGQLLVFAAGNSSRNLDLVPLYPAAWLSPHMIKVASTDGRDLRAATSSYGATTVDLGAPGLSIYSCQPGGLYQILSGTSMAAPHVTGTAALAMSRFPQATSAQIRRLILDFTDPVASMAGITVTGGRLNAFRVLTNGDAAPPGVIAGFACTDSGATTVALSWLAPGDDGDTGTCANYELRTSTGPIDAANFALATAVPVPAPQSAGSLEALVVGGLVPGTVNHFALRATDDFGNRGPLSTVSAATRGVSGVEALPLVSSDLRLVSGNPGHGTSRFELSLPGDGQVDVEVFDLRGSRVRRLAGGHVTAGNHPLFWDSLDEHGRRVPQGVYLVRARTPAGVIVRRVTLIE